MMPASLLTSTREIQEIVDRSTTELELVTNLVSFAVDLINEDDFVDFSNRSNQCKDGESDDSQ